MTTWTVTCPQCGTPNEVSADIVRVECGLVSCTCVCINCTREFSDEQPYWRWLQLDAEPPTEPEMADL